MATERLSMRTTREILRQRWALERPVRAVAASVGRSVGAIHATERRARDAGLDWAAIDGMTEAELEARSIGGRRVPVHARSVRSRTVPTSTPNGGSPASRSSSCTSIPGEASRWLPLHPVLRYLPDWLRRRRLSMRQVHRAGEKGFVDYAGKTRCLTDPVTGEQTPVELFVYALGASSYTYAEATRTQQLSDWIASHTRAFAFFGGSPAATVCDQLKSGVTTPCRYEPGVHRLYAEMATHYGTTILPARPAHPRDKPKAEVAVQVAERWIVARLRHETFFTLDAMNERIAALLARLNRKPMRHYGGASRRDLFEQLDRPALQPLPADPFEYAEWKRAKVNIDYHIVVDHHAYSVPHALVHAEVEARLTASMVEVFERGQRVALHRRSFQRGGFTTDPAHMPKSHQAHAEWTPSRFQRWAATIGPDTAALVTVIRYGRAAGW